MKWKLTCLCALACSSMLGAPAHATTLAPGQTLQAGDLSQTTYVDPSTVQLAYLYYQLPDLGTLQHFHYVNAISTGLKNDGGGIVLQLTTPQFGLRPPLPGDPIVDVGPLPSDATISLPGFAGRSVDVAIAPTLFDFSIGTIARSSSGDVITLSGFQQKPTGFGGLDSDQLVFTIPGTLFIDSYASIHLLDVQGDPRNLQAAVFAPAPVPEPLSATLLPLAMAALAWRMKRKR